MKKVLKKTKINNKDCRIEGYIRFRIQGIFLAFKFIRHITRPQFRCLVRPDLRFIANIKQIAAYCNEFSASFS